MKTQYRDIVKKLLYYSGYYRLWERLNAPSENRLLILMYHDFVTDEEQHSHWSKKVMASESQFDLILTTLKKHYRVMTVEDAVLEIRNTGSLKERSAAITLDDGYLSAYDIAFPLLKARGLSATIFLSTDWIDGRSNPWWMQLTSVIDQCDITPSTVAKAGGIVGGPLELDLKKIRDTDSARRMLLGGIEWNLMKRDDGTRTRILQDLHHELVGGVELVSCVRQPMTWDQIREMAAHGIRFGAHTCSHPNLSHVDLETAEREIVESRRVIQQRLGTESTGFAYPYGYDVEGYRRFRPILEKHGFHYACTSWCGYVDSASDPYLLGRIGIPLSTSPAIIGRALSLEYCTKP